MLPTDTLFYWNLTHPERAGRSLVDGEPEYLEESERARADRFHFPLDAARYRYFHSRLREVLAGALNEKDPSALSFGAGPQGKPELLGQPNLHFNLTHSKQWAAVALSAGGPVGVDLELVEVDFPCLEIARNYFCGAEITAVQNAADPQQCAERFYHLWTAKEAVMKATGLGMTLEPQRITLAIDPATQRPCGIAHLDYPGLRAEDWKLHFLATSADLVLAVVGGVQLTKVVPGDTMLATTLALP